MKYLLLLFSFLSWSQQTAKVNFTVCYAKVAPDYKLRKVEGKVGGNLSQKGVGIWCVKIKVRFVLLVGRFPYAPAKVIAACCYGKLNNLWDPIQIFDPVFNSVICYHQWVLDFIRPILILVLLQNNLDLRRFISALRYKNSFFIKIKNSFFLIPTRFFLTAGFFLNLDWRSIAPNFLKQFNKSL